MTGVRLTPAARRDLSSIWDFTVDRWDAAQAETYLGELRSAIERVAADPARGRACDEIREGYRRYGIGAHVIFFVERDGGVDVVRILHQRMDPGRRM
jgi:toxin ParE1/3/4